MSALTDLIQDLRYVVRSAPKHRAFPIAAILTLALGIGANTAIFSIVYGILLRPLPYEDASALVFVRTRDNLTGRVIPAGFARPDAAEWRARSQAFASLALCAFNPLALDVDSGFESVSGALVSDRFFSTLGAPMAVGRAPQDPRATEIVISDRLWRERFAGDRGVIGRSVRLNGQAYTIVGVAPAGFEVPSDAWRSAEGAEQTPDLWAPAALAPGATDRSLRDYEIIARLKPGAMLDQGRADARTVAHAIQADAPAALPEVDPVVISVSEAVEGGVRPALLMLVGAVGLVLLVACANVAHLVLARQASHRRELLVRIALGAPRRRLLNQVIGESAMLALAGGFVGVLLARWTVPVLLWVGSVQLPRSSAIRIDIPVLLFGIGASLVTALVVAIAPALQLTMRDAALGATDWARTQTAGRAARRLRAALVVGEVGMSMVLLVGAVLFGRSFVRLLYTNIGATADHVVAVELNLAMNRTLSPAQQVQLTARMIDRVAALPGITAAGAANALPPNRSRMSFQFEMPDPSSGVPRTYRVGLINPTPEYFTALGIHLLSGRLFSEVDGATAPLVAIVGARTAYRLFGTIDVVGRPLPVAPRGSRSGPISVVGVVDDVRYAGLDVDPGDTLYLPFAQRPFRNMTLVARTAGDPRLVARALTRAVHALDRDIMLGPALPLDEVVSNAVGQPRLRTVVLMGIALLALALAAVGLYGVIAYSVSQRTVEIGVRMALGARMGQVVAMVLREGLGLAMLGVAVGGAAAAILVRTVSNLLYGVHPLDPASFAAAGGVLLVVTAVASYVPARRATNVDPLVALRSE